MILKKPYAFLIKHFKLIHLLIAVFLCLITYKFASIVSFFNSYVSSGYQTSITQNLGITYTPFYLYILVLFVVTLTSTILVLLNHKKKPYKLYLFMTVYYGVIFLGLFYITTVLNSFETDLLKATVARSIRDILFIIYIPQFIFIIYTILRGIGFNVKHLDFKDDISELSGAGDSEEFEINVKFDSSKIKRGYHRTYRELGYYFKENKFIITCLILAVVISIGTILFVNRDVSQDQNYRTGSSFMYNNANIVVNDSIITNMDYKGNKLKEGYFLVINVYMENNSGKTINMDYNNFKLNIGNKYISPSNAYINYFLDYTQINVPTMLSHLSKNSFGLVYKLNDIDFNKKANLTIYNGSFYNKGKSITKKIEISLNPKKVLNTKEIGSYIVGNEINFSDSNLLKTKLKINKYQITNRYIYKYKKCIGEDCSELNDIITIPSSRSGNLMMVADVKYNLDKNSRYTNSFVSLNSFVENFIKLEYTIKGKTKQGYISNLTPRNTDNIIAFEVPSEINDATKIDLIIQVRDCKYIVNIKS